MLQKCSIWNVASVFFKEPNKKFELIEISKKIKLAHTSVKKHLLTLIKLNIINSKKKELGNKKSNCYFANKRSAEFLHYKKIYNIDSLKRSEIINFLSNICQPNSIVLFGSYEKGEDSEDSDIDLFVESSKKDLDLHKFEKILQKKIEIHFKNEFKDFPTELKNNIINGKTLYGFLDGYDD